jgi:hypothetical protein
VAMIPIDGQRVLEDLCPHVGALVPMSEIEQSRCVCPNDRALCSEKSTK